MLISIIVPSWNQGRYIARTLESIFSQDHRPLEVIVVDGASTDDTVAILRDWATRHPELRWLSEPDEGPADAVNKGLAMARGEVAAIQSSDDLYTPGALSAVAHAFEADPEAGFLIGHYQGVDMEGRLLYTERLPEFSWEAYFGRALALPQSSIFFRMKVAREAGGWNRKYFGCDIDYWLRILLRTKAIRLDRILSVWRLHAGGRTHQGNDKKIYDGYLQMIEDNVELRTASPRIRRLARASCHIVALRFHPTGEVGEVRKHALRALLLHPTFWRYQRPRALLRLLPGVGLARRIRDALKG